MLWYVPFAAVQETVSNRDHLVSTTFVCCTCKLQVAYLYYIDLCFGAQPRCSSVSHAEFLLECQNALLPADVMHYCDTTTAAAVDSA